MKRITVFCGSSFGHGDNYTTQATLMGQALAKRNIELVYGGARVGLMGAVANAVLDSGGRAIGVLPKFLKSKEIAHEGLSQLILVETMHERKTTMNDLSDGIIALPGGYGTLEEFFEMLTWAQLGLHEKPIGILNVDGFYEPLIALIQTMVDQGFLKEINQSMLLISNNINVLLDKMDNYVAPKAEKWINKETV